MPLYRYKCDFCGEEVLKIMPIYADKTGCKCGKNMDRMPCRTEEPTVKVLLDKNRNKSVIRNINKIMKKRSDDYFKKVEIHEAIAKHGIEQIARSNKGMIDLKTGKIK